MYHAGSINNPCKEPVVVSAAGNICAHMSGLWLCSTACCAILDPLSYINVIDS
jgi:hypothetical protein